MFKSLKNISAMTICLLLATNVTVFASTKPADEEHKNPSNSTKIQENSYKRARFKTNVFEKLGITKEDIDNGRKTGKTLFDIAKEKGHSEEDVKKLMIEEKSKYIDDEVQRGAIPKEKAEEIKTHFKEKIEKWDGKLRDNNCSKPLNKKDVYDKIN
ncbi:hypothetical protein [Clostridium akagii]|uniref:hypothetical protein n=1 Tax=Clostridium akagii TaxID=91623 RepID=UPI00068E5742|nr:hypothetical protein [Clostridium akagii]